MDNIIEHKGIILKKYSTKVDVQIIQNSACSGCHAKAACTASDSAEKIVEITTSESNNYEVGQEVTIVGTKIMGWKAVGYAFVLPFFIMSIILVGSQNLFNNELYAGLLSLAALVPYYFVLYLFKDKMKSKFGFTIKA